MKKQIVFLVLMAFLGAGVGAVLVEPLEAAVSNAVYAGAPPYVGTAVTPNVLILLDNSGSMGRRTQCANATGTDFSTCPPFDETKSYGGLYDHLSCYTYNATDTRFEVAHHPR